jgi:hypothetical protein
MAPIDAATKSNKRSAANQQSSIDEIDNSSSISSISDAFNARTVRKDTADRMTLHMAMYVFLFQCQT